MDREESVTTPPEQPPPDGREKGNNLERYGRYRVPRRSEPPRPDLQLYEVKRGTRPGSRYVRITPSSEQPLRRMAPASRDERTSWCHGDAPALRAGRAYAGTTLKNRISFGHSSSPYGKSMTLTPGRLLR